MHDFKDVLAYNLDRRRRSPVKPAKEQAASAAAAEPGCNKNKAPARKPAAVHAKPRLTPALSPKSEDVKMPSSTGGAHQGKVDSEGRQDHSLPKSTARHPGPSANADGNATEIIKEIGAASLGSPDSVAAGTSAVATAATAACAATNTATAAGGRPYVTPANRRKAIQTPSSRPSTSRNHAALADGQFQPTPLPHSTPATVVATAGHPKNDNNNNANFRSPQPRTVFGNKKRAANSMEESKIGGTNNNNNTSSIARLVTSSSPVAAASAGRSSKKQLTATTNKTTREPMEPITLNLKQFGKGPGINRPNSCPPLFKTSASTGVLGKRPLPPLPPLPAPSAQKTSQAAALSGHFFSQEKELLAFMSDKQSNKSQAQGQGQQRQKQKQHPALAPRQAMPLVVPAKHSSISMDRSATLGGAGSVPAVGPTLGWAFSQLKQQQGQQ
jgi:hypothetical protein